MKQPFLERKSSDGLLTRARRTMIWAIRIYHREGANATLVKIIIPALKRQGFSRWSNVFHKIARKITSAIQRQLLWLYHRLPPRLRTRIFLFYAGLVQKLFHYYSATAIANAKRQLVKTLPSALPSEYNNRHVSILAPTFFDLDGNNMFYGGAERYLIELVHLIRNQGYDPVVYQAGNSNWVRYYSDIRVQGMSCGGDFRHFNEQFHSLVPPGVLTIYLTFYLANPYCHPRSIGISHGIYWDDAPFQTPLVQGQKLKDILTALANLERVVSVDTNTVNWVRSFQLKLADKFTYIPNFVDPQQFCPPENKTGKPNAGRLIILYPRRLYEPRGFWLVAEILPELVEKYTYVDFHFVGKADPEEEKAIRALIERHPGRVHWYFLAPERMHEAYQKADITIIPTLHSEGTSLSCLEALASGNAVIATNVGGLPDLVLPGYNGLLIEPNAAALRRALQQLIEDEDLRLCLGRRGRQVAEVFSLERWQAQWQQTLNSYLPAKPITPVANHKVQVAVFPAAGGITWEPIKQRPHHLALQLVNNGIETFWGNDGDRQPSPKDNLHIISARDDLYLKEPLVFIYFPYHFADLHKFEELGRAVVVYDILDDISIYDKTDELNNTPPGMTARDYQLKLLERADIVITSARILEERIKIHRPDVLFVPNGVDLGDFCKDKVSPDPEMAHLKKPLIGFHGAIAEWLDYDLLLNVIQQRPQYQFVFVGPVSQPESFKAILKQPNVLHLGVKPYKQIPSIIAAFDLGILPFVLTPLTEGVRPLKVLEYLAMGKPVVATPLPDLIDWPGVLRACTPEEFAKALDLALESRSSIERDPEVTRFVAASSWEETVKPLIQAIKDLPS